MKECSLSGWEDPRGRFVYRYWVMHSQMWYIFSIFLKGVRTGGAYSVWRDEGGGLMEGESRSPFVKLCENFMERMVIELLLSVFPLTRCWSLDSSGSFLRILARYGRKLCCNPS